MPREINLDSDQISDIFPPETCERIRSMIQIQKRARDLEAAVLAARTDAELNEAMRNVAEFKAANESN